MLSSGESQRSQLNSPGARSPDTSKSDRPYTASSGPSAQYLRVRVSARHCCGQGQSLELKQKPVERSGAGVNVWTMGSARATERRLWRSQRRSLAAANSAPVEPSAPRCGHSRWDETEQHLFSLV